MAPILRMYEERDHLEGFEAYSPRYNKEVADAVMSFLRERNKQSNSEGIYDLAVDVACGSGQLTEQFPSHFKQIIGIDISPVQIEIANKGNKFDNIKYVVAPGESIPVDNESVDLVSCATSLHWLDYDRFMHECKRVLKSEGCLVVMSYDLPKIYRFRSDNEMSFVEDRNATDLMRKFVLELPFPKFVRYNIIEDRYRTMFDTIPCEDKQRNDSIKIGLGIKFTMRHLEGLYESYCGYQTYIKEKIEELKQSHPDLKDDEIDADEFDILKIALKKLKQSWNLDGVDNNKIDLGITWDVWLLLSARPEL